MKNFVSLSIAIAGALCAFESAAQSVSDSYTVDADYAVGYVSSEGSNESKSEASFVLQVSAGVDGSVWVASTDQGKLDQGGGSGSNWVEVLNLGAHSVSVE